MSYNPDIFRQEVLSRRADRLTGDVFISVPGSWHFTTYLVAAIILSTFAFLALTNYSRTAAAEGVLVSSAGVAAILPIRDGIISDIFVKDGDAVRANQVLVRVQSEENNSLGGTVGADVALAISSQSSSIISQINDSKLAAEAQYSQLKAQQAGLSAEISQLESQITYQSRLMSLGESELSGARDVAERGFISRRDLQLREENVLARKLALSQLRQAVEVKRALLLEAGKNVMRVRAEARMQRSNLELNQAQLKQQAATVSGSRAYVMRAPLAGRITALSARVGQPTNRETPFMTVVPTGSVLAAEMSVPNEAIGFVKIGQEVRLAIDAFPYQRFGTVPGVIQTISATGVRQQGRDGKTSIIYPVTVSILKSDILAYGKLEQLFPGMTFRARIVVARQSLLQWLFEPLRAVERR